MTIGKFVPKHGIINLELQIKGRFRTESGKHVSDAKFCQPAKIN